MANPPTNPIATSDKASTTDTASVIVNVLANDSDPDATEKLTLQSVALASGLGSVSIVSNQLMYQPDPSYRALTAGDTRSVVVNYTIIDQKGLTAQSTATITVNGVNESPVVPGVTVTGSSNLQVIPASVLLANVTDAEHQTLSISAVSNAKFGIVALNNDGTVSFQPTAGFAGTASFSYSVSDGHGGTGTGTASIGYQAQAASAEPSGAVSSITTGAIVDAVIAPDSKSLFVDTSGGTITRYDLATGAQTGSWQSTSPIGAIDVTSDGRYLVAIGSNAKGGTQNFNPFPSRN